MLSNMGTRTNLHRLRLRDQDCTRGHRLVGICWILLLNVGVVEMYTATAGPPPSSPLPPTTITTTTPMPTTTELVCDVSCESCLDNATECRFCAPGYYMDPDQDPDDDMGVGPKVGVNGTITASPTALEPTSPGPSQPPTEDVTRPPTFQCFSCEIDNCTQCVCEDLEDNDDSGSEQTCTPQCQTCSGEMYLYLNACHKECPSGSKPEVTNQTCVVKEEDSSSQVCPTWCIGLVAAVAALIVIIIIVVVVLVVIRQQHTSHTPPAPPAVEELGPSPVHQIDSLPKDSPPKESPIYENLPHPDRNLHNQVEMGHEKVTRYVTDPTLHIEQQQGHQPWQPQVPVTNGHYDNNNAMATASTDNPGLTPVHSERPSKRDYLDDNVPMMKHVLPPDKPNTVPYYNIARPSEATPAPTPAAKPRVAQKPLPFDPPVEPPVEDESIYQNEEFQRAGPHDSDLPADTDDDMPMYVNDEEVQRALQSSQHGLSNHGFDDPPPSDEVVDSQEPTELEVYQNVTFSDTGEELPATALPAAAGPERRVKREAVPETKSDYENKDIIDQIAMGKSEPHLSGQQGIELLQRPATISTPDAHPDDDDDDDEVYYNQFDSNYQNARQASKPRHS